MRGACGLVYDLVTLCGLKQAFTRPSVQVLIQQAQQPDMSTDTKTAGQELHSVSTQHTDHTHSPSPFVPSLPPACLMSEFYIEFNRSIRVSAEPIPHGAGLDAIHSSLNQAAADDDMRMRIG